jgi:hypothetical protein
MATHLRWPSGWPGHLSPSTAILYGYPPSPMTVWLLPFPFQGSNIAHLAHPSPSSSALLCSQQIIWPCVELKEATSYKVVPTFPWLIAPSYLALSPISHTALFQSFLLFFFSAISLVTVWVPQGSRCNLLMYNQFYLFIIETMISFCVISVIQYPENITDKFQK